MILVNISHFYIYFILDRFEFTKCLSTKIVKIYSMILREVENIMAVPKWSVDDNKLWFNSGLWQEGVPKHPDFPVISLGDWFDQKTDEFAKNNVIWFLKTLMKYGVLKRLKLKFCPRKERKSSITFFLYKYIFYHLHER